MALYLKDTMPHHGMPMLPLGPPMSLGGMGGGLMPMTVPPPHQLASPPSPVGSPHASPLHHAAPALNLAMPKLSPRSEDTSGTGSSNGASPPPPGHHQLPPPPTGPLHPRLHAGLQYPHAAKVSPRPALARAPPCYYQTRVHA